MECVHFRPRLPNSGQLGIEITSTRIDACELLLPAEARREEYHAALLAKGFKLAHALACPVAAGGRWKACPYYVKPEKRGHRRR